MSFGEIVFAMVMIGVFGLWVYGIIITDGDTMRKIFWDNTAIGWIWREYFSKKKKVKQAPPQFTMGSNTMYINHPLQQPTAFNTSSNFTFPIQTGRPIGKPLVIQNWDRLIGMIFPISISNSAYGNWIVTRAGQTTDGYECMFENGGGFGNSNRAVTLTVYSDIYDLNRVMVKCGGRMSTMDIETFKDPNNMLYRIANEFQEKFR
jgi:hypothetical protein